MSGRAAFALGLLCGALLSPSAAAAEPGTWFLHFYTGLGLTEDSDLRLSRPAEGTELVFREVGWEDHSLSAPSIPYIGVRVGRYLDRRPWLGLALDVIHYKVFAEVDRQVEVAGELTGVPIGGFVRMESIVQNYEVANGVNLFLATALARARRGRSPDLPQGRRQLYAGLGVGVALLYTHSRVLGESRRGYELGRGAAQLVAGFEQRLGRRWSLFAEVKRTWTEANGSIAGGRSFSRLDSNHLVVGGGWRF